MEENIKILEDDCFEKIKNILTVISDNSEHNKTLISQKNDELNRAIENLLSNFNLAIIDQSEARKINNDSPLPKIESPEFAELVSQITEYHKLLAQKNEKIETNLSTISQDAKTYLENQLENKSTEPRNKKMENSKTDNIENVITTTGNDILDNEFNYFKFYNMITSKLENMMYNYPTYSKMKILAYVDKNIRDISNIVQSTHEDFEDTSLSSLQVTQELEDIFKEGLQLIHEPENKYIKKSEQIHKFDDPVEYLSYLKGKTDPYVNRINSSFNGNYNQLINTIDELKKYILTTNKLTDTDKKILNQNINKQSNAFSEFLRDSKIHYDIDSSIKHWQMVKDVAEGKIAYKDSNLNVSIYHRDDNGKLAYTKTYSDAFRDEITSDTSINTYSSNWADPARLSLMRKMSPEYSENYKEKLNNLVKELNSTLKKYSKNDTNAKTYDLYITKITNICNSNFEQLSKNYQNIGEILEDNPIETLKSTLEPLSEKYDKLPEASEKTPIFIDIENRRNKENDSKKREDMERKKQEEIERKRQEEVERKKQEEIERKRQEEIKRKNQEEITKKCKKISDTIKNTNQTTTDLSSSLEDFSNRINYLNTRFEQTAEILGLEKPSTPLSSIQEELQNAKGNANIFHNYFENIKLSGLDQNKINQIENKGLIENISDFNSKYASGNNLNIDNSCDQLQSELKSILIQELYRQSYDTMQQEKLHKYQQEKENIKHQKIGLFGKLLGNEALKNAKLQNLDYKIDLAQKETPKMPKDYNISDILCDLYCYKKEQNISEFSPKMQKYYNGILQLSTEEIIKEAKEKFKSLSANLPSTHNSKGFFGKNKQQLQILQKENNDLKKQANLREDNSDMDRYNLQISDETKDIYSDIKNITNDITLCSNKILEIDKIANRRQTIDVQEKDEEKTL